MKKLLVSILLLVYFTVSTGFVVSLHYCMGRLDSGSIGETKASVCGKCGMHQDEENKCCRDEISVVKLQTSHLAAHFAIPDFGLSLPLSDHTDFEMQTFFPRQEVALEVAHGPPLSRQDTYLRNCVFRI
jgi:hypothetical protein